jgi:hypothetical protein
MKKMSKYNSQGWHFQTERHSNARKTGRAGGCYVMRTGKNADGSKNYLKLEVTKDDKIDFLMKSNLHTRTQLESLDDSQLNDLFEAGLVAKGLKYHREPIAKPQTLYVSPARGASEEAQDKLILASAKEKNLNPNQLGAFAYFMKHRLKGEQDPHYTSEWAGRFKNGRQWDAGDYKARKVLKECMTRYSGFTKDDDEYMERYTAKKKGYKETARFKGENAYEDAVASAESQGTGKYKGYTSFMDGSFIAYYK